MRRRRQSLLAVIVTLMSMTQVARAQRASAPTKVPPGLEIEVLDPSVDAGGNPAVELSQDPHTGRYLVDIPPVVLVHRYYYTGNRSFRGPMLPGGPTIAVVNHPRTGERQYVELQMMPGAPRVHYTSRSIEYDFGEHAVSIVFGKLREVPVVKYRNRPKVATTIEKRMEQTGLPKAGGKISNTAGQVKAKAKTMTLNAAVAVAKVAQTAAIPVVKIAKMLPGAQWVLNPNADQATGAGAAEFCRDLEVKQASREAFRSSGSLTTLR